MFAGDLAGNLDGLPDDSLILLSVSDSVAALGLGAGVGVASFSSIADSRSSTPLRSSALAAPPRIKELRISATTMPKPAPIRNAFRIRLGDWFSTGLTAIAAYYTPPLPAFSKNPSPGRIRSEVHNLAGSWG
jgi:hypothetical protein